MSFAITLFSNAPASPGFVNTVAHFKVRLAEKLSFDTPYEVALEYITFPKTWYNVFDEKIYFIDKNAMMKIDLPKGYYETSEAVVDRINSLLHDKFASRVGLTITKIPKLIWEPFTKTSHLNDAKAISGKVQTSIDLILTQQTRALIGYVPPNIKPNELLKVDAADINAGFRTLLAYSNIADYSFVGNSRSQLLELIDIPTTAKFGDQIPHRYNNPRFVPLLDQEIQEVEIVLKTDFGETIPFRSGRTAVRLLFRPRNG